MSRRLVIALLAGVPLLLLAGAITWWFLPPGLPDLLPTPSSPALPDLAMTPLTEISGGELVETGDKYVKFTAAVANVGAGPFMLHAVRGDDRGRWRLSQRFAEPDGSTSEVVTPGAVVWGGHGHNHWHVQLGASYWLTRPGSSVPLRRYEKVGFCFFDQRPLEERPPDSPVRPRFPKNGCNRRGTLEFTMGISPGWADPYTWGLPDQRLSVSGLQDGVYRLWATADPGGWFRETNEGNNRTWVDLRLTLSSGQPDVDVVRRGPAGAPAWVSG